MALPGYWVECIPFYGCAETGEAPPFYSATINAFPEIAVCATTPGEAIEEAQKKLRALSNRYRSDQRSLPEPHNPLSPPRHNRSIAGWLSVYIPME